MVAFELKILFLVSKPNVGYAIPYLSTTLSLLIGPFIVCIMCAAKTFEFNCLAEFHKFKHEKNFADLVIQIILGLLLLRRTTRVQL